MNNEAESLRKKTPVDSPTALPLWQRILSLGLAAIGGFAFIIVLVAAVLIFQQPNYAPGDIAEKQARFRNIALLFCTSATLLLVFSYLLRRRPITVRRGAANGFPWVWTLLGISCLTLLLQLVPNLRWSKLSILDVGGWTWRTYAAISVISILLVAATRAHCRKSRDGR